jgi:hypothetical protein
MVVGGCSPLQISPVFCKMLGQRPIRLLHQRCDNTRRSKFLRANNFAPPRLRWPPIREQLEPLPPAVDLQPAIPAWELQAFHAAIGSPDQFRPLLHFQPAASSSCFVYVVLPLLGGVSREFLREADLEAIHASIVCRFQSARTPKISFFSTCRQNQIGLLPGR